MSAPTLPSTAVTTVSPRPHRRGTRVLVAVVVVTLAAGAVGRFLTAGRSGPGSPRAGAPAPTADPITTLEGRVAANADDAGSWQALAGAYVGRANASGDPAYYDLARRAADTARRLAPADPRTSVASAIVALGVHDFAHAATDAAAALATDPIGPDALAAAVDAAVELGHYEDAAALLQRLLDVKPAAPALARASYLRELHGDLPGARATMARAEQAAGTAGERAGIAAYAGDIALADGDLAAAAAAFDRALALSPGHVGASLGRARVQFAQGDLAGARGAAQAVVDRSPQPAAAALVADLADAAGDTDAAGRARALLTANTQLAVASGVTVDLEAALEAADHGDPEQAVTLAQRAHDTRATVFTADALGWALTKAGRPADALWYVRESLALGTANAALHVHAAVTFAADGQPDLAAAALRTAFALSPWPAFHLRAVAAPLASTLAVPVPPMWRL